MYKLGKKVSSFSQRLVVQKGNSSPHSEAARLCWLFRGVFWGLKWCIIACGERLVVKELMDLKRRWNPWDSGRTSHSRKLESRGWKQKEGSPVSEGGTWAGERRESSKLSEKPDMGKTQARSRNLNNIHNLMCLFIKL